MGYNYSYLTYNPTYIYLPMNLQVSPKAQNPEPKPW